MSDEYSGISQGPSLTAQVTRGAGWVLVGRIIGRGMQAISLIILARLLAPDDFGLFGIISLGMVALETFTVTGFNEALIQQKGHVEKYLDTAWTIHAIRGVVLASLLYTVAPSIAWFFNEPRAVPLFRVMSLAEVVGGLANPAIIYFRKELEFQKQVAYELATNTVSLVVGVIAAYCLRNAWALVLAALAGACARCLLSYMLCPYRPQVSVDIVRMRQLMAFGKWVLGSSVMIYVGSQLDNLSVGKLLGTTALGFYATAYRLSLLPLQETTHAIGNVVLSAYAKVQVDTRRLQGAYLRAASVTTFVAVPVCIGMAVVARPMVQLVLGEKWLAIVLPMQILAIAQLIKSLAATGSPLFIGAGRPAYEFYIQLARALGLGVFIVPGILCFGLPGAGLAVVASAVTMFALCLILITKTLRVRLRHIGLAMILPLAGGAVMYCALFYPIVTLADSNSSVLLRAVVLTIIIVMGAVVYLSACFGMSLVIPQASVLPGMRVVYDSTRRSLRRILDFVVHAAGSIRGTSPSKLDRDAKRVEHI